MTFLFILLPMLEGKFFKTTYTECDQVIGYWSLWEDWSQTCECKTNYEVTRFGHRFVKERKRKCFCGEDNKLYGCDTWCGMPHDFIDEEYCDETIEVDPWTDWSECISLRQTVKSYKIL